MQGGADQPVHAVHAAPAGRPNRLARETSPYLLQHRLNPVDWYPWGEEAFAEARRRDVPIFLSIGYSTCYWCHVMERESFESAHIARLMNDNFVCIKVDREERPDVDDLYMAAVQAFSGHGGWPMSVFLEPNTLKPFYAGTYFPAEDKFTGMPSFPRVLGGMTAAWREQRPDVLAQAEQLAEVVRERVVAASAVVQVDESEVTSAVSQLLRLFDRADGGFGPAPKFPQPVYLELLLAAREAAGDESTRDAIDAAVKTTLDRMALGGLFDQVGGGFHRYSTDGRWLVPHFEKMLYDNALLAPVYAQAGQLYADEFYKRIARRTCDYVLREMVSPEGGFYSAQDAEVSHREGQNYLWTPAEMRAALNKDDAELAIKVYQVTDAGNFRDPHHPEDRPSNVLSLEARPAEIARRVHLEERTFLERLDAINARLLAARAKRDQPGTDTKVLSGWNGLMIAAMARCGSVLQEARFTDAARRAADFVLASMRDAHGGLLRSFSAGRAQIPAFLEDYAMLARGLLGLHDAGVDREGRYVGAARELAALAESKFGDPQTGAYHDTLAGQSDLFVRPRSVYDGAVPSGTSVMLNVLIDLHRITGDRDHLDRAATGIAAVTGFLSQAPLGAANSSIALLRLLTVDRAALDRALADARPASHAADLPMETTVVEILAPVKGVEIGPDEPTGVTLKIRIDDGYHLTAAIPGTTEAARDLIPFKVHIVNGAGAAVYADYPAGEPFGEPGREVMVYKGEFDLRLVLERVGQWSGRPLLAVTYQPCTQTSCLRPRTVELDVAIDRK